MGKDAQVRVDNTIAYIAGKVPATEQQQVRTFLTNRMTQMAQGGHIKGISDPMSMTDLSQKGTEDERHIRRSLIMIELAGGQPVGATAKSMAAGQLATTFAESLRSLRWVADQNSGTGQVIGSALTELLGQPLIFLQKHVLSIFGSETDGPMQQYFVYEKQNQPGLPHKFAFYSAKMNKHLPSSPAVQVANVPAVVWRDVPGRGSNSTSGSFATIKGTDLGKETVMLTTQFSGCCFCYKSYGGGQAFAAHIMPGAQNVAGSDITGGGKELAMQLAGKVNSVTGGDFDAPAPRGGQLSVYGREYSNIQGQAGYSAQTPMTLIGLRRATWEFYSQEVVANRVAKALKII